MEKSGLSRKKKVLHFLSPCRLQKCAKLSRLIKPLAGASIYNCLTNRDPQLFFPLAILAPILYYSTCNPIRNKNYRYENQDVYHACHYFQPFYADILDIA